MDLGRPPTTWLVTREAADAGEEQTALEGAGVRTVAIPCIECVERSWPRWPEHPGAPVAFLTSRRAARAFLKHGRGETKLLAAMSPATTAVLEDAGVAPTVTASGGAVALARALTQVWEQLTRPTWHVRYPTSDAGLEAAEQAQALEILSAIGPVERAAVYTTRAPPALKGELEGRLQAPWAVTFSSPSAVEAFFAALPPSPAPRHAVCHGRSTASAWDSGRPSGWPTAQLTTTLVDTVISLEATP